MIDTTCFEWSLDITDGNIWILLSWHRMALAWRRMLMVSSESLLAWCACSHLFLDILIATSLMQPSFVREFSITSMKGGYRRVFQRPIGFEWYVPYVQGLNLFPLPPWEHAMQCVLGLFGFKLFLVHGTPFASSIKIFIPLWLQGTHNLHRWYFIFSRNWFGCSVQNQA